MNVSKKDHGHQKQNKYFVAKTKLALLMAMLIAITGIAQQGINYKALIKDGGGNVVASQGITVQFIIYEGVALTNNVYQETHSPTTDANGIVIVNISEGVVDSGVYADIAWGSDEHYLNVQINTGGGLTDMGTTQFMAVPFALSVSKETIKIDDLSDGKSDNNGFSLFLGINAGLNDNASNNQNVGIGFEALKNNVSGGSNTAIGMQALNNNTTGILNSANGSYALFNNTIGIGNTANGSSALLATQTGNYNTANGSSALSTSTGNYNTANGSDALFVTIGDANTAIGMQAGYLNQIGSGNIFIGYQSGYNEQGSNTLYIENSNADADNALIYGEFNNNILRTNSTFQIGNPTGTGFAFPTIDGTANQILQTNGNGALTWVNRSSLGAQIINDLTDGKSDDDGSQDGSSLFLGLNAGFNDDSTDNRNVGIGLDALKSNTSGIENTSNGYSSLISNTTGNHNTANGYSALLLNDLGNNNTAFGSYVLNKTTGSNNTAIGRSAGFNNSTGSTNIFIGYLSGFNELDSHLRCY